MRINVYKGFAEQELRSLQEKPIIDVPYCCLDTLAMVKVWEKLREEI